MLPFPISVIETLNALQPDFLLFLGACITSALPLFESLQLLTSIQEKAIDQNHKEYQDSVTAAHKHGTVFLSLLAFLAIKFLSTKLALLKNKLHKMSLNQLAMKKQAESANEQTLKYLQDIDMLKRNDWVTSSIADTEKLKKLKAENEQLKAKVEFLSKEQNSLIVDVNRLENEAKVKSAESKKDK